MDKFDDYLKEKSTSEDKDFVLPKSFENKIEETLESLDRIDKNKINKWYENKKLWATAACFAFVCLAGLGINNGTGVGRSSSNYDSMLKSSNENSAEKQIVSYDSSQPEVASEESSLMNGADNYSDREYGMNEIIDAKSVSNLIIKYLDDYNKYKVVSKQEDIDRILDFINNMERTETVEQNLKEWDFLIETNGLINHLISIENNIMNIDDKWYEIDLEDVNILKNMYNELNYNENDVAYGDY